MTGWEWVEAASWVAALIGLPFGVVAAIKAWKAKAEATTVRKLLTGTQAQSQSQSVVNVMLPPGYSRVVLEEAGGRRTHEIRADVGHSAGEPESPREEPK